ncbi:MAG: sugar ABC transporter permease [Spirochaetaceae bacterium]|jgi:multiple sugar transport system permease protein|nr:sugar ABC transporter permease [Spirochaetaceae bacterium]
MEKEKNTRGLAKMEGAKRPQWGSKTLTAFLFLLPFLVLYTVFIIWPVIQGVYVSLHKWGLMGKIRFLGLSNYTRFLTDRHFWESLGHTTWFVLISVPLLVVVPVCLGILANRGLRMKKFLRIAYYVPSVLSVAVISRIARWMFDPYNGFLSFLFHDLGILAPGEEIMWFREIGLVWTVITLTTVWWTIGFSMMLVVSALQDIPEQLYEAADLDGAGKTRQLFRITLPLLKPVIYLILLLQIIASFKVFGQIQLITGGAPGTATRPLILYIYESAFRQNDLGYGTAMSYALFIILVVLSYIQLKFQQKKEG